MGSLRRTKLHKKVVELMTSDVLKVEGIMSFYTWRQITHEFDLILASTPQNLVWGSP